MGIQEENAERKFQAHFSLFALKVFSFLVFWAFSLAVLIVGCFAVFGGVVWWAHPHPEDWYVFAFAFFPLYIYFPHLWLARVHYKIMALELVEAPPGPAPDQNGT